MRIVEIEEQVKNVQIIKEDTTKKEDKVMMGTTVTILSVEENEKQTYKIVGSTESSILAEVPRISNESIIGKALLGKKKGDVVKIKAGAGAAEYKILELK
jgi:transcription elongation factor GreA